MWESAMDKKLRSTPSRVRVQLMKDSDNNICIWTIFQTCATSKQSLVI